MIHLERGVPKRALAPNNLGLAASERQMETGMTDLSHLDRIVDDPDSITEVVLKAMSDTDDGRLTQIVDALVRHAHAFFREVRSP